MSATIFFEIDVEATSGSNLGRVGHVRIVSASGTRILPFTVVQSVVIGARLVFPNSSRVMETVPVSFTQQRRWLSSSTSLGVLLIHASIIFEFVPKHFKCPISSDLGLFFDLFFW